MRGCAVYNSLMQEPDAAGTPLPSWKGILAIVGLFFFVTILVYGGTLTNNFVSLDDPYVIYHNLAIRGLSLAHVKQMFTMFDPELFTPLTFLSFALNYAAGGLSPFPYHLTNLVLHTLNALLVAWVMLKLTKNRLAALFLGLLFAVHPVNTEVVAWATARKEVLSTFFFLLSLLAFLLYRERSKKALFVLSLAVYLLGLLSKVTIFTLPVLVLLIDWRERRPIGRRTALETAPFFALSIVFGIIGVIPKSAIFASTTFAQKILMAAKSVMFYLWKFLIPTGLSVLYPNTETISLTSPGFLISSILFLCIGALVLLSLRKTREIAFGFGFFLIAIAPTLLHFNRNASMVSARATGIQFASDHYLYLPSLGLFFLAGTGVLWWISSTVRDDVQWKRTVIATSVSAAVIAIFAVLATVQSSVWASSEKLFAHTLRYYPASAAARVNLSVIYRNTGREDEEKRVLEEGLPFGQNSKLFTGLGAIAARSGNTDDAERYFALAGKADPTNAEPHFSRGAMLAGMKKFDAALGEYRAALEKDPQYVAVWNNIGSLKLQQGKNAEAEEAFRRAIAINPTFAEGTYNLALLLASEKRPAEAIGQFERFLELEPDSIEARIELIPLYLETNQPSEALLSLRGILARDPENPTAKSLLQEMVRLGIVGAKK